MHVHVHVLCTCWLLQERSRNTHLQSEVRSKSVSQKAMSELQEMLGDLRAERDLLKQANDRLMKGWGCSYLYKMWNITHKLLYYPCSKVERGEQQNAQLLSLQERVSQLEAAARQDGEEKTIAMDRLVRERGQLFKPCTCIVMYIMCTVLSASTRNM